MSLPIKGTARLLVGAGKAAPSPAIGQMLGPLGVNMNEFCKQFNAQTNTYKEGVIIPVYLTAFTDRTFAFTTKTPPVSWFLKQCAGIEKGAAKPGHDSVGEVSVKHIYEIAKIKKQDPHLNSTSLENMCKSIAASAKSMGIKVHRK